MDQLAVSRVSRCTRSLLLWGFVVLLGGCARNQLHPIGGNEFTLFPGDGRVPSRVPCTGKTDERFQCFEKRFTERAAQFDIGGALAIVAEDGAIHSVAHTDSLNAKAALTADEHTRFPAASVSKMFLAAATVSLAQEGLVDLHTPIAKYWPEALATDIGVGQATLHQLMTHTSGVAGVPQCTTADDKLEAFGRKYGKAPLWSPPGAVYNYSNVGYSFIALVLQKVTGAPYDQVVKARVLEPVGLMDARYGFGEVKVHGHPQDPTAPDPRCEVMLPSGGLTLPVRDLVTWVGQLARPDTFKLGRPLLDLLTAPHVETGGRPGETYGYGVVRQQHDGLTIYSHSGSLHDFTALAAWVPERSFGVAAFVNGHPQGPSAIAAGFQTLSTFLDLSPNWSPKAEAAHPLQAYAGLYVDRVGTLGRFKVSLDGDRLTMEYLDGPPSLLPANFRFVFDKGSSEARYVVTAIGVGTRESGVPAK